ncbi:MAG: CPBP family glutamic-type intramembrane protease, partial [Pirellulales bacterium]
LLIAPCSAQEIVLGKFLAVFAITLVTLAANVISIAATSAVSLKVLSGSPSQSLAFATAGGIVLTLIVFIGLASVGAATCLAVTTAAKSGKEAQNTLTPVILLVSALAGAALLPGMQDNRLLPAVPFVGHVLVSQSAFTGVEAKGVGVIAWPLLLSLVSSVFVTWLLLRVTAVMLTDEDTLFRGQDSAASALTRPNRRARPTLVQGAIPPIMGLASLWYAQAFMPKDLLIAIPVTQVATVLLPLALLLWWQRVDIRQTFSVYWPGSGHGLKGSVGLIGAALLGGGTFVIGAAALIAFGDESLTQQAQDLSLRIVQLILSQAWWISWFLMGVVPAVCEELLFRGWTLSAFAGSRKTSGRVAIAVFAQAFLFAVAHVLPERMPQTFILGLILGWITITTGSILPAMIGHMVHNSMPLVMLLTSDHSPEELLAASTNEMLATGSTNIPLWAIISAVLCIVVGALLVESIGRKNMNKLLS